MKLRGFSVRFGRDLVICHDRNQQTRFIEPRGSGGTDRFRSYRQNPKRTDSVMQMWTLMQSRMDRGMPVPDTQSRPVVQTPTPRDDQTPPRRSRTPVRWPRGMDECRSLTRSRSPIRRSSPSESSPRDASPVDFSAALDTAENVKDKFLSDEEDDEGSQRKVSAAQYQLFRQAVTSSKGSFKVNPGKSRRVPRASLLDLGETEVTDRVSWLDQPSLVDTMTSTARIAQGLKEDEEVEKTTLSETLNTSSSSFKHLSVKQIFTTGTVSPQGA